MPPSAPPADAPVTDDGELQLFMPGALTGTRPKGGRVEWEVLGRRDRAALNENFARELFELFTLGRGHYSLQSSGNCKVIGTNGR